MSLDRLTFQVGALTVTVHQGQVPDGADFWDSNRLDVAAEVDLPGQAWVRATRSFLMTRLTPDNSTRRTCPDSYGLRLNGLKSPFNPSGCEKERNGFRTWSQQSGDVPDCWRNKRNPYHRQLDTLLERFPVRGRPD
ncbi:hypothetical protein ACFQDE_15595 [Deinococcus caeni]|uniref:hypothetical protein n=1 Tax=Deinococcus caeni TaxID=569127 RepID=UPI00361484C8